MDRCPDDDLEELLWKKQGYDAQVLNTIVEGTTAPIQAVKHRCKSSVQFMLDKGADPTIGGNDGKTAVDWARKVNNLEALG